MDGLTFYSRTSVGLTHGTSTQTLFKEKEHFFLSLNIAPLLAVPECSKAICDVLLWCEIHRYGSSVRIISSVDKFGVRT